MSWPFPPSHASHQGLALHFTHTWRTHFMGPKDPRYHKRPRQPLLPTSPRQLTPSPPCGPWYITWIPPPTLPPILDTQAYTPPLWITSRISPHLGGVTTCMDTIRSSPSRGPYMPTKPDDIRHDHYLTRVETRVHFRSCVL